MRYEILGPLRLVEGDSTFSPRAHKIEALLGALLVRADQLVSTEQLMGEIWHDELPGPRRPRCTCTSPNCASSCTGPDGRTRS
ncbi:hypothetical protein ACFQ9X_38770 [Catenulispora yoronensis]